MADTLDDPPSYHHLFMIILLISVGYLGGMLNTVHSVQETSQSPSYNLTCPEPIIKTDSPSSNDKDELRTSSNVKNYIQNPETKIMYEENNDSITVEIDAVSEPEGMSMRPTIFTGNTVLLEDYQGGVLNEGQIIRYKSSEGGHVIHRIRASYLETQEYLLVKGDNTETEERVDREDVTHLAKGILYT